MQVKADTRCPQQTFGPWSAHAFAAGQAEISRLAHEKASPAALAEELQALKGRLDQIREYERFDPHNLPGIRSKKHYREVAMLRGPKCEVACVQALPDQTIVSGSADGAIRRWTLGRDLQWRFEEIGIPKHAVNCLQVLPDGTIFTGTNRSLELWKRAEEGMYPRELISRPGMSILDLQVLPDGRIVTNSTIQTLHIWQQKGDGRWEDEIIAEGVNCFQALPNGRIVAGMGSCVAVLSKDESWGCEKIGELLWSINAVDAFPNGRIVTGNSNGEFHLWSRNESGTWRSEAIGYRDPAIYTLLALPDETVVAASADLDFVTLWRRESSGEWSGEAVGRYTGHIRSLQALPDGRIVAGCSDGTIRIYEGTPINTPPSRLAKLWGAIWK